MSIKYIKISFSSSFILNLFLVYICQSSYTVIDFKVIWYGCSIWCSPLTFLLNLETSSMSLVFSLLSLCWPFLFYAKANEGLDHLLPYFSFLPAFLWPCLPQTPPSGQLKLCHCSLRSVPHGLFSLLSSYTALIRTP